MQPEKRLSTELRALITARKQAKNERDRKQPKLIENREVHKASIEAKLSGIGHGNQYVNFLKCGREEIYKSCKDCGSVQTFYYSCNRKWCPLCNYKIGRNRAEQLKAWASRIKQPKHVVLTMRNFEVLTRKQIRRFQKALIAVRRQKTFAQVAGGCCSIEITNSGEGWHVHAHLLVDARWIPADALALKWGKLLGQEFGIVKVKDVRDQSYVQEVSKYVAKGSELATWDAERLHEFIQAIKGCRFYFTFGSLRAARKEIARELNAAKPPGPVCDCGCDRFTFETEEQALINQLRRERRRR